MISAERQELICSEIEKNKFITINELVNIVGASVSTVRRDLIELESIGRIQRTHGGAVLMGSQFRNDEMTYGSRSTKSLDEKDRIGKYVANIIQDSACIILDTGTTTLSVAEHLKPTKLLRVITDSLDIANILRYKENIDVIMIGGVLKKDNGNTYGTSAIKCLEDYHAEACIVGASGLTIKEGLTKHDIDAVPTTKKMIEISHQLICVTDSSKVGLTGLVSVCGIKNIDKIVTDIDIDSEMKELFENEGVEVDVV